MRLRRYRTEDLPILARLFGETVRQVNCRDYTLPQVEAWAAGEADLLTRDSWFQRLFFRNSSEFSCKLNLFML